MILELSHNKSTTAVPGMNEMISSRSFEAQSSAHELVLHIMKFSFNSMHLSLVLRVCSRSLHRYLNSKTLVGFDASMPRRMQYSPSRQVVLENAKSTLFSITSMMGSHTFQCFYPTFCFMASSLFVDKAAQGWQHDSLKSTRLPFISAKYTVF